MLSREEQGRIWGAFRALSPRQQEVFVLRHLEEWSTEEVAEMLGLTVGSVKRHLFRAVHHLRKARATIPPIMYPPTRAAISQLPSWM